MKLRSEADKLVIADKQNESKIADLENQIEMSETTIRETLEEKYILDQENAAMELRTKPVPEDEQKKRLKNLENQYMTTLKLKIKFLNEESDSLMERLGTEEDMGRKKLDATIKLNRQLELLKEDLEVEVKKHDKNRV